MNKVDVIIETPKGSGLKYVYDPKTHLFKLKKLLPLGMVFPYDFGFIPNTKGEDGDPLDAIVFWEFNSFPGCIISCRVIGAIKAKQDSDKGKIRNDRFIMIAEASKLYNHINSISKLPNDTFSELKQFFINYTEIEKKGFKIEGVSNTKEAMQQIKAATILNATPIS